MKAWLKGGLIGIVVSFVVAVILFVFAIILFVDIFPYLMTLISYLAFPWSLFNIWSSESDMGGAILYMFSLPFGVMLNGFIIGAIIGLIIGKIKSKQK